MSLSMLGVICLVCTLRSMIQCFVAAAFGVVAECATLLHNLVMQQKLHVSYLVAESCNKLRNKNLNSNLLYFSVTCCGNAVR